MQRAQLLDERYGLLTAIGGGGMGTVWLAEDRRLKRDVAIKFLKAEYANDDELRTRFEIEAQAMAKVNHPCIAEIYDVGHEGNQPYLVMEYINGQTLTQFLRDNAPLPEPIALEWLESIARGVAAIHRKALIHRDLKPNNILLPNGGERERLVKIVDFGIARNLSGVSITTEMGRLFYTPQYAAPEQMAGRALTPASDVYTLGVILYEMLGGQIPANLYSLRGAVSAPMFALLTKLLQHEPTVRPADGAAVLELVRQFATATDTTRPDAPPPDQTPTVTMAAMPPDAPTRVHATYTPIAPPAKTPPVGMAQQMRNRLATIQNRPADPLSPIALLIEVVTFLGGGLFALVALVGRGMAGAGRRIGGAVQSHANSTPYTSPAITQTVRRAAGAAGGGLYAGLYGAVNGLVVGAIGGVIGGIGGWFFWSWTTLATLRDLWNAIFSFDVFTVIGFFVGRIAPWSLTAAVVGAALAAVLGFLLGLASGGRGAFASRGLHMKMLYSFFGAIGAVVWGLVLTFTHLLLAAIPLGLWALSDDRFTLTLFRLQSFTTLIQDICYWAALGSIGWAITLSVDMLFDLTISRSPWGNLVQAGLSALLGAVALGSGSFILWIVLSGVGLTEAFNPITILIHIRYDVAVKVGLLGGLLIGFLRGQVFTPKPPPAAPIVPPPTAKRN